MDDLLPIDGEMIIVDNNSVDRTPKIAMDAGARVVFEPINQISRARNCRCSRSEGEILVFSSMQTQLYLSRYLKKA